ncbi:hypothetical protein NA57DRAFT_75347 [Rhizodiscina lignyota]|uniref:60S ribosomal protein L20 n=1 Tax=Rhizodiscina lignyota TaxID=1504668 RepID=A0A9P4IH00_9PEZI|nr:hypothetical protein NA57DRAFT_75347 [Rhizodiscina lignyota]
MPPTSISRPLLRPLISPKSTSFLPCKYQCPAPLLANPQSHTQVRHESSRRRLIKRLRLPPAPSFAQSSSQRAQIIFNPPSSAPNVYHTPLKFLPKSDPRRRLYSLASTSPDAAQSSHHNPSGTSPIARPSGRSVTSYPPAADGETKLPPPLKAPTAKRYHLTQADVDEMRRLRAEDPKTWTRAKLVEKFDCSSFFVAITCKNVEAGQEAADRLEEIKRKWGPRKRRAREDRVKRKEMWGRDQ